MTKPPLLKKLPQKISNLWDRFMRGDPDEFLKMVSGVIHVGANIGQERHQYAKLNLRVAWFEPIAEVFAKLQDNIKPFERQVAYQYLLTDSVGKEFAFNVASNNGESSSIYEFGLHKQLRPDITMHRKVMLEGTTLDELVRCKVIDLAQYQALLLDTQGAELLVLKGAANSLRHFQYVKVEAANFESYVGGCTISDIAAFMTSAGFAELRRDYTSKHREVGRYFEVVYKRTA